MTSNYPHDDEGVNDHHPPHNTSRCNQFLENNDALKEMLESAQNELTNELRVHVHTKANLQRVKEENREMASIIDAIHTRLDDRTVDVSSVYKLSDNGPQQLKCLPKEGGKEEEVSAVPPPVKEVQTDGSTAHSSSSTTTQPPNIMLFIVLIPLVCKLLMDNRKLGKKCAFQQRQHDAAQECIKNAHVAIDQLIEEGLIKDDELSKALNKLEAIQALNASQLEEHAKQLAAATSDMTDRNATQVGNLAAQLSKNHNDMTSGILDCFIHEWEEADARRLVEVECFKAKGKMSDDYAAILERHCQAQSNKVAELKGQVKVLTYLLSFPRASPTSTTTTTTPPPQ